MFTLKNNLFNLNEYLFNNISIKDFNLIYLYFIIPCKNYLLKKLNIIHLCIFNSYIFNQN